ncbi:MFS transporter [Paenibacillus sp. GSMTC-2017]|uniref:MFS transporter n=1 Tax=Paenibacillus sp. GSMTC-2017 TaxID=2794350 RepID=UPI0018D777C1|nr:MFS transporter [Paenibacillus sp. GSMTC-2017]MBH5320133.1 MFS transporter [Paenibacillus sp. GSMTC-2017]
MPRITDSTDESESHPKWLQCYLDSPIKQQQLYKRTLIIVVLSQIFGGAGLAAGITVGALLAQDMVGAEGLTGAPTALFTLGSAIAALLIGRYSERYGRRIGLASGFIAGGIGAIGVVVAAVTGLVWLLFVSLFVYGAGTATNLQARYAGTDMATPKKRATAISIALVSTTLGAVAGPNLVDDMGRFATSIGVPALAGPFILAAAAFIIAGLVLLVFLRPDPLIVAKAVAAMQKSNVVNEANVNTPSDVAGKRGIVVGATIMVLTQIVMVAIMTMTPIHMSHHGHSLSDVGLVIGIHVGAMYLPSLITGYLVDRIGRTPMAIAAGVTLLAAGTIAATVPGDSIPLLIVALALLGLGWNFGLISGTTLIVDATTPSTRAKMQGKVDVTIALAGASSGAMAGIVVASSSYTVLSFAGGILALLFIPVVVWSRRK